MSTQRDLPLRAAIALGITASSLIAGGNLVMANVTIPSLLARTIPVPTPVLLMQWEQHYDIAKSQALPLVAVTVASYGYAIYRIRNALAMSKAPTAFLPSWELLAAGIGAMVAVPLFTVLFMEGPFGAVNSKLHAMNADVSRRLPATATEGETKVATELCQWWAVMCGVRAMFPLAASILGIWAAI